MSSDDDRIAEHRRAFQEFYDDRVALPAETTSFVNKIVESVVRSTLRGPDALDCQSYIWMKLLEPKRHIGAKLEKAGGWRTAVRNLLYQFLRHEKRARSIIGCSLSELTRTVPQAPNRTFSQVEARQWLTVISPIIVDLPRMQRIAFTVSIVDVSPPGRSDLTRDAGFVKQVATASGRSLEDAQRILEAIDPDTRDSQLRALYSDQEIEADPSGCWDNFRQSVCRARRRVRDSFDS